MRVLLAILMVVGGSLLLTESQAQDKSGAKEVTLKGKITCAKCDLSVEKTCMTVIVTKIDGKDVTVYFDKAGNKANHSKICTEAKKGSVTGTIADDGKKKVITVKTVKFD